MRSAAEPRRLKRATRSATVEPLCKPAAWAAWTNTPVRATASSAVARRKTSTQVRARLQTLAASGIERVMVPVNSELLREILPLLE